MDDFEYYYLKQIIVPLVNYLGENLFSRAPFKVQRIIQHLANHELCQANMVAATCSCTAHAVKASELVFNQRKGLIMQKCKL